MRLATKKRRKMVIPKFASASAEAAWFDRNRKKLEADMSRRIKTGDIVTVTEALVRSAVLREALRREIR